MKVLYCTLIYISSGQTFVYVITHPPTGDRIEVFQLKDNYMLQHQRSITDPSFRE